MNITGFSQDWAEDANYLYWLVENNYAIADADANSINVNFEDLYYPRVIYVKYLGDAEKTSLTNRVKSAGQNIVDRILDIVFPTQPEKGGNGLFGFGLFPALGNFLKPFIRKFWYIIGLLLILLFLIKRRRK